MCQYFKKWGEGVPHIWLQYQPVSAYRRHETSSVSDVENQSGTSRAGLKRQQHERGISTHEHVRYLD